MKTENIINKFTKQFDKELKAILMHDLKNFNANKGKFLNKNQVYNQDKDLLVA